MYDNLLDPARGIIFGIAAGAVLWTLIALLIWSLW